MQQHTDPTYRIFLVEDDDDLATAVTAQLERYDYAVTRAADYDRVAEEFARVSPHLVILDVNLPRYDGFLICRRIREIDATPVLFISARDGSMDQVMGLSAGGDDYLTKPFAPEVLRARVEALLRRAYEFGKPGRDLMEHDGMILDVHRGTVRSGDRSVELSRNELRILATLLSKHGSIVSRDELIEALWQRDAYVDENTLTVNVNRLRRRLDEIGRGDAIVTRKQQGYMIP
ncbi:MAG: response regulator transcription factor [Spirochaetota bacterium]